MDSRATAALALAPAVEASVSAVPSSTAPQDGAGRTADARSPVAAPSGSKPRVHFGRAREHLQALLARLIVDLDDKISRQLDEILHHPHFQRLEASRSEERRVGKGRRDRESEARGTESERA